MTGAVPLQCRTQAVALQCIELGNPLLWGLDLWHTAPYDICIKLMAEQIWHTKMLPELAFLKSSKVSVSPIDNMRNPSKLVNKPLVHHATDWGLLMPMAAPKQTCAKQVRNVKSHNA